MPQAVLSAGTPVKTQLVGDGDAFVENNETWNLTIPLTNTDSFLLQRSERLAQGHAADAVPPREVTFCGQAVAGREPSAPDRRLERGLDLRVRRTPARLDRRLRKRDYGLDFRAWT